MRIADANSSSVESSEESVQKNKRSSSIDSESRLSISSISDISELSESSARTSLDEPLESAGLASIISQPAGGEKTLEMFESFLHFLSLFAESKTVFNKKIAEFKKNLELYKHKELYLQQGGLLVLQNLPHELAEKALTPEQRTIWKNKKKDFDVLALRKDVEKCFGRQELQKIIDNHIKSRYKKEVQGLVDAAYNVVFHATHSVETINNSRTNTVTVMGLGAPCNVHIISQLPSVFTEMHKNSYLLINRKILYHVNALGECEIVKIDNLNKLLHVIDRILKEKKLNDPEKKQVELVNLTGEQVRNAIAANGGHQRFKACEITDYFASYNNASAFLFNTLLAFGKTSQQRALTDSLSLQQSMEELRKSIVGKTKGISLNKKTMGDGMQKTEKHDSSHPKNRAVSDPTRKKTTTMPTDLEIRPAGASQTSIVFDLTIQFLKYYVRSPGKFIEDIAKFECELELFKKNDLYKVHGGLLVLQRLPQNMAIKVLKDVDPNWRSKEDILNLDVWQNDVEDYFDKEQLLAIVDRHIDVRYKEKTLALIELLYQLIYLGTHSPVTITEVRNDNYEMYVVKNGEEEKCEIKNFFEEYDEVYTEFLTKLSELTPISNTALHYSDCLKLTDEFKKMRISIESSVNSVFSDKEKSTPKQKIAASEVVNRPNQEQINTKQISHSQDIKSIWSAPQQKTVTPQQEMSVTQDEIFSLRMQDKFDFCKAKLSSIKYEILHEKWDEHGSNFVIKDVENGFKITNTVSETWAKMFKLIKEGERKKTPAAEVLKSVIALAKKKEKYTPAFYKLFVAKERSEKNNNFLKNKIISLETEMSSLDSQPPRFFYQPESVFERAMSLFEIDDKGSLSRLSESQAKLEKAYRENDLSTVSYQMICIDSTYNACLRQSLRNVAYKGSVSDVIFLLQRIDAYSKEKKIWLEPNALEEAISNCERGRTQHGGGSHQECLAILTKFKDRISRKKTMINNDYGRHSMRI